MEAAHNSLPPPMNHPSLLHPPPPQPLCGRRTLLRSTAAIAALAGLAKPASLLSEIVRPSSESIVKLLFESLQPAMIRAIFEGITNPEWHKRFDRQLADDVGGFGNKQSIAIFGEPQSGKFEFVLASRHMTLRCDGDSAEHVAFGGPILYAHEGENLREKPDHPSNVFWHQAVEANKLYHALDPKQRELALVVKGMPTEERVGFKGREGQFQGCPVSAFSADQKQEVQRIL